MTLVAEHRRLVRQLAAAADRRDADLAAVERSYLDGVRALDEEMAGALAAVDRAVAGVAAAGGALAGTDAEAERLWRALRQHLGWRGRRLPPLPGPASAAADSGTAAEGSTVDGGAAVLLARAAGRLAGAARPEPPGRLPRPVLAWLPLVGAAAAGALGLVAGGLAALATAGFSGLAALGWATFLLAPFAGLPVAHAWVVRRYRARLDGGAVGLTVLGGMAACCVVALLR